MKAGSDITAEQQNGGVPDEDNGLAPDDIILEVQGLKMYFPGTSGSGLRRTHSEVKAVDGVDLFLRKGETLGLVGESGCGKTTLGRCILRLYEPTAGTVLFNGVDLAELNGRELRQMRRHMQIIFQDPYGSLDPRMTAGQLIAEPLIIHRMDGEGRDHTARVAELLSIVGLQPDVAQSYPFEFSGGERQRLSIARALALNPSLVICDEPVSALDVSVQAQVVNLLEDLQKQFGLTYLFISHDLAVVSHIADRVAVMYLGQIVEVADRDELFANPKHPYTKALISAVPVPDPVAEAQREPQILTGELPSPSNKPPGCPFHPRCPIAITECKGGVPPLREIEPDHWAACIRV